MEFNELMKYDNKLKHERAHNARMTAKTDLPGSPCIVIELYDDGHSTTLVAFYDRRGMNTWILEDLARHGITDMTEADIAFDRDWRTGEQEMVVEGGDFLRLVYRMTDTVIFG